MAYRWRSPNGWIDSTATILDDDRGRQLFTPRKPKSSWTRLNRRRAADMESKGLMTEAGRRTIVMAKENGWWTIFDAVEDLIEPDELRDALDAVPAARSHWDEFSASARKLMLWWVISTARADTRSRRIESIVAEAQEDRKARS